ncbi:MAG: ABC transporter substrate-binding protein [Alphaproteobacteria bacterium]
MQMKMTGLGSALVLSATVAAAAGASAQDCSVTIGSVVSLTGPAGPYGQAAAHSIELAFQDINQAGGVAVDGSVGCMLEVSVRDAQSQGTVAADAARQLVDLDGVPVIIGGIISSVSMPILTSVTAPSGIVQVSPASSSPSFTALAREGKTGGYWFRTITSDALQGTAAARYALDSGLDSLAVIHVNNDFGVNMVAEFRRAFEALGGTITSVTPYNESQSSYNPEVAAAMAGDPKALYLIAYPSDGATVARTWISQGGPQVFLLNDGMNSAEFVTAVGAEYLNGAYGTSSGTTATPSTEYFASVYSDYTGGEFDHQAPAADRAYDAAAIVGLAVAHAGSTDPDTIRDAIRAVLDPEGEVVHAGMEEFGRALELIAAGQPIRYVGVIGAVQFDDYGDITGPFRLWRIQDGEVVTTGEMSTEDVAAIMAEIDG